MILDKLLSNLTVTVAPYAQCLVANGWRLKLPVPTRAVLHFVLRGDGRIADTPCSTRILKQGYMAVVPLGCTYHMLESGDPITSEQSINEAPSDPGVHRIHAGPAKDEGLVVACGAIDVRYGEAVDLFHGLDRPLVVDLSMVPQVRNAIDQIFTEQHQPVPGTAAMTGALMMQCLLHMFRRLPGEGDRAMSWLLALQDARLARVVENVLDDPSATHTVETLSDAAAMSRSAFAALFTRSFGRPPMTFVHHIRMQRACELLNGTVLSVDEIATRVGFASRSHFAQSFKKHTSLSPQKFRDAINESV
jgi:AraC family transcriptional activator of mtrCDE